MESTKLKNLKKGDYFTLKPIEEPTGDQVYIKGDTKVYTDFIF